MPDTDHDLLIKLHEQVSEVLKRQDDLAKWRDGRPQKCGLDDMRKALFGNGKVGVIQRMWYLLIGVGIVAGVGAGLRVVEAVVRHLRLVGAS